MVWFAGISTIVGYFISNPVYKYILNMYDFYIHKSTKLNSSKYCYVSQTIQLNMSHLFTYSWMIKQLYFKQFYLTCHLFASNLHVWLISGATTLGQSGPGSDGSYWSFTIRLFSVISGTLIVGRGFGPLQRYSQYILQLQPAGEGKPRYV